MRTLRWVVFGVAFLATAMACGGDAESSRPDILFVLIDSIKASHLGCYGYTRETTPNLDRFAEEECVRFETVIPGGSWTVPAVMTLFTSLPADEHGRVLPDLPHDETVITLAETLRSAGYETVGITANGMVSHRFGYAKGFDFYDDYSATLPPDAGMMKAASGYAKGMALTRMGLNRLKRRDPSKPLFLFLFYMDPHWDYAPPPPFDAKFSTMGKPPVRNVWALTADKATPTVRQRVIDAYDGEIAYCDMSVSNLLAAVSATPRWNDTIVIIAGDHGESFWERGFSGHGNSLYDEELKVPLMIRIPKNRGFRPGTVVRGQVGGIDLAPTLLDLAGVPIPRSWKGISLRSAMMSGVSEGRPVVAETRVRANLWQRAVRTDRYKVIAVDDFEMPGEVYDLQSDPGETNDLVRAGIPLPEGARALVKSLKPCEKLK